MTALRILHVDDEPDIRELVDLSLGLDPAFSVRSCASGSDAVPAAADWCPDMILCDVMMPVMDGPTTLLRLRECPQTVETPVVFMTARAQPHEVEYFKSLGATGVILKPFDPMTLAKSVRCHMRAAGLATLRKGFVRRMRSDAAILTQFLSSLRNEESAQRGIEQVKAFAHALAGSSDIFGFEEVSEAAATLEATATAQLTGSRNSDQIVHDINTLLDCIGNTSSSS
jgi:CheY-like chemotaxis protein/HPt (histidine-containing phosphotransfer) domain-containing protein